MLPREIKAELIRQDISLTDIANEAGVTVSQVSQCISGEGRYERIREIVARRLGKKVDTVFTKDHLKAKPKPA